MITRSIFLVSSLTAAVLAIPVGCSSSDGAAAGTLDAGATTTTSADASCLAVEAPTDGDRCATFDVVSLPDVASVTTQCLPATLANERAKSRGFGELGNGTWVLTEAYDPSPDCATNPRTLTEVVRAGGIFIQTATSWLARADGAIGKTTSQFVRLPPEPGFDAGADAGPLPSGVVPPVCPLSWPQVNCVDLMPFYAAGFFTGTPTELRLYRNTTGNGQVDAASAQLFAVYKSMP